MWVCRFWSWYPLLWWETNRKPKPFWGGCLKTPVWSKPSQPSTAGNLGVCLRSADEKLLMDLVLPEAAKDTIFSCIRGTRGKICVSFFACVIVSPGSTCQTSGPCFDAKVGIPSAVGASCWLGRDVFLPLQEVDAEVHETEEGSCRKTKWRTKSFAQDMSACETIFNLSNTMVGGGRSLGKWICFLFLSPAAVAITPVRCFSAEIRSKIMSKEVLD